MPHQPGEAPMVNRINEGHAKQHGRFEGQGTFGTWWLTQFEDLDLRVARQSAAWQYMKNSSPVSGMPTVNCGEGQTTK